MNIGHYFYSNENKLVISIDDFIGMKKLKSNRISSAYIDTVSTWSFENNKTVSDNMLATLLHFSTKHIEIPQNFIDKHNIKKYHISLIRRMYIEEMDMKTEGAMLCYKRPYGNSNVLVDILEEYEKSESLYVKKYWEWINNRDIPINIHNETMNIFDLMLNELELNSLEWIKENNVWIPTEKGKKEYTKLKRENKLNRILNE